MKEVSVHQADFLWPWPLKPGTVWSQTDLATARPLHIAAYFGHLEIAKFLIDHGASVDCVDDRLRTPLHFAAKHGRTQVVKLLIHSGTNVNALNDRLQSPCMKAAYYSSLEPIQLLVEGGSDLTLQDWRHQTALYLANYRNHRKVVVFLITNMKRCLLKAEAVSGDSALSMMLRWTNPSYSSFILNIAPNPSVYEPQQSNVLSAVAETNSHIHLKMLLRRLPKALIPKLLAHRDRGSGTPLYAAATRPAERCIDILLEAGADLELEGGHHGTPLMGACATGRLEVGELWCAKVQRPRTSRMIKSSVLFPPRNITSRSDNGY